LSPFLIHMLLYPQIRSNLLKYFASLSLSITSPIRENSILSSTTITSQKTNSNTNNKSQDEYQVEIIRELNKEFLMHFYTIYTKCSWSMLMINNPILISMCNLCINLMSSIRTPYHIHMPWHHSSSPFFQSLGLWPHIMWHVMWPQSYVSLS